MRIQSLVLLLGGFSGLWSGISFAEPPPYIGELIDGTRISGLELRGLQDSPAVWKLDETQLFGDNPLRWLKDRSIPNGTSVSSFIEFRNGDLLPGEVSHYFAGGGAGDLADPCLVFSTTAGSEIPDIPKRMEGRRRLPGSSFHTVRLDPTQARRIVWQRRTNDAFTPKTLYYRDGRSTTFRSLRWEESSVKILGEQGPATVDFDEIAELHLDAADPWSDYIRQLAILSPDLHGRIAQFETDDGARLTASTDRFQMPAHLPLVDRRTDRTKVPRAAPNGKRYTLQVVQPVWSLDPIWLDMAKLRTRRYFGPHEVPLSALSPASVQQSTSLARSWQPQVDSNAQGGPLINGEREYGWGWGVHAFNRLEFDLPPFARTFQTKIGLDQVAGKGGCAKGMVLFNSGGEQTLFASPVFIGSKQVANSGTLNLPDVGQKDRKLILLADPLLKDSPPGADPLEIGDVLDWLEPLVTLDPQRLKEEVSQQVKEDKAKQVTRTDRELTRETLESIAPGFEPAQPDLLVQVQRAEDGSATADLLPNPVFLPQLLRRLVEVPANKVTKLKIVAVPSSNVLNLRAGTATRVRQQPDSSWTLVVVVNGSPLATHLFDARLDPWEPQEIDLTPYAGRRIALEIDTVDPFPASTSARFKRIEIVSTDSPPPKEEKKAEPIKP